MEMIKILELAEKDSKISMIDIFIFNRVKYRQNKYKLKDFDRKLKYIKNQMNISELKI